MARSEDNKSKPREMVLTGLTVASAFTVFNFAWNFRSDVEKVVASQAHVLKPSREHIQSICAELVREEQERSRQEHTELREAISWIMRYINQGRRSEAK